MLNDWRCGIGFQSCRGESDRIGVLSHARTSYLRVGQTTGLAVLLLLPLACQQQMAAQPSYKPLDPSEFFADSRSARPVIPGTVARGHLRTDAHLFTGMRARKTGDLERVASIVAEAGVNVLAAALNAVIERNDYVATFPFPVTHEVLEQGRNRYMIYCVVCHDSLGTGRGKIVERGYTPPPSFHIERLREAPAGHFFDVITRGYGSMPEYKEQVPPRERWAIVAYIRALQLSQRFPEKELPEEMRKEWQKSKTPAVGGQPR